MVEREHSSTMELQKYLKIQEKILKQKSKAHWIEMGDGNNNYFFKHMMARASINTISVLKDADERTLYKVDDIKNQVL